MQNKGAIRLFAIVFALVCLYQLSFTVVTNRVEKRAKEYANSEDALNLARQLAGGDEVMVDVKLDSIAKNWERHYLDSMNSEVVYNLLVTKFTYSDCKEKEINLGLDLKGGMNVTMEVKVVDIIRAMAGDLADSTFNQAVELALSKQKSSTSDYVTLFGESWTEVGQGKSLAPYFIVEFKGQINSKSTDDEVMTLIRTETEAAIDRSFNILRSRIDRFGVTQPNIQRLPTSGRILVELPGIKEPERVRKLLQSTAKLEFFEVYNQTEIYNQLIEADKRVKRILAGEAETDSLSADTLAVAEAPADTTTAPSLADTTGSGLLDKADSLQTGDASGQEAELENYRRENPLFAALNIQYTWQQNEQGQVTPPAAPIIGYVSGIDTARINRMLDYPQVKSLFPRNLRFMWSSKTTELDFQDGEQESYYQLLSIRMNNDMSAHLEGDKVVNAFRDLEQTGGASVTMRMDSEGASTWARLTEKNIKRSIAIVLDGYVQSFPVVQNQITGGTSSITGNFTLQEADDLANILKSGKLPAPAHIVQEEVVGPSLGQEAINAGLLSFVIAFALVLFYMILYYSRAGLVADLALVTNVFFIFGVLASLNAVLTLPGIAGIVLTLGMAVDANVIIYERIKEELRIGKGVRLAISDGYKNAYSAIIDGNVTTLLVAIILAMFGSGPVQGFATTLIIGILTSLFSSIFISRLIFIWILDKNKKLSFSNKRTENFLAHTKFDFIGKRKTFYVISIAILVVGLGSMVIRGFNMGVDFAGGRTYVVRFDKDVNTNEVRNALSKTFVMENGQSLPPEVKTFGRDNQIKVTTKYLIDQTGEDVDAKVEGKLFEGVKSFYTTPMTFEEFTSDDENKVLGRLSSQLVGPTIADDIKRNSIIAMVIALIVIFIYIAIRFKRWQFGLGGVTATFHDALISMSMYSIFYGILPFNLEVDQAFVAAILTIIGYSINDTVIVFDRIREYRLEHPKRSLKDNMNAAINSTLARTLNTAGTTFVVLFAIFLFGGEVIRGFAFVLMIGIVAGTYSSIFNASAVSYDLLKNKKGILAEEKKSE
jgi:SecD/SecF fusion protein